MPTYRYLASVAGACWLMIASSALAAQHALIVVGMTGSPSITADLSGTAQTIQASLVQRGFAPDAIEVLGSASAGAKVTTDLVLASLKKQQALAATDEFWLDPARISPDAARRARWPSRSVAHA